MDYVQSAECEEFLRNLHNVENYYDDTGETWTVPQNEVYLADKMLELYTNESSTYRLLSKYQGSQVPRLLARFDLNLVSTTDSDGGDRPVSQKDLVNMKGVITQFLPGFQLSKIADHAPQSAWQDIVDQAIQVANILGDEEILNEDVRPDNFIVLPKRIGGYQVFMIDFALCRHRREGESDSEWGREKQLLDEEGAVGFVMQNLLGKLGFKLDFRWSNRYGEWAEREKVPDVVAVADDGVDHKH